MADYSDWRVREPIVKRTINGVETPLNYYLKYFGFYNFHVLDHPAPPGRDGPEGGVNGGDQMPRLARQRRMPPTAWKRKFGIQRIRWGAHSGRFCRAWPTMTKA